MHESDETGLTALNHNEPDADELSCPLCYCLAQDFFGVISRTYPEHRTHVEIALALSAVPMLAEEWRPISVIFEGPPGTGKSTVPNIILGIPDEDVRSHFYRS